MSLLTVDELTVTFGGRGRKESRAVDGISFEVDQGQVVGLVGESGCGKSVTSLALMGLLPSKGLTIGGRAEFDGTDLSKWSAAKLGTASYTQSTEPAPWKVENGYFEVVPGSGDIATREKFGDIQLHVEWAAPASRRGNSQDRGNSGILLMGLYEIQVLDTYNNPTYADGTAGAIYGQWPPLVNAVRPPGEWQSYDIVFEAPVFEGDRLVRPAYFTVFVNGIVVQNRKASLGPMVWRQVATYKPHAAEGPILLQDHSHPVRYRNIWLRRLTGYDRPPSSN